MKIYTRGGDKGRTSLFSGGRVDKDDTRIEALGSIDELVAALGLAKAVPDVEAAARQQLEMLQTQLYLVMADIAAGVPDAAGDEPGGGLAAEPIRDTRLPGDSAAQLEAAIDALEADLPPLADFVIPGASPASAALHLARTVCRRAERRVLSAAREHVVPVDVGIYLNRLSDLLFVLARWVDRETPGGGTTFKERL